MKLTKFEKDIQESIKKGDAKTVRLSKAEREGYREAARAALAKDKIITVRINGKDLKALQAIALESGKKYQTYLGDLIHEHVAKRKKAA
jgi:predicted DNA binding CopG/RHH family protein